MDTSDMHCYVLKSQEAGHREYNYNVKTEVDALPIDSQPQGISRIAHATQLESPLHETNTYQMSVSTFSNSGALMKNGNSPRITHYDAPLNTQNLQLYGKLAHMPEASRHIEQRQDCKTGSPICQKPFACSFNGCNQSFFRAGDARRHMLKHGSPKLICSWPSCDRIFYRSDKLRNHVEDHLLFEQREFLSHVSNEHDEPWSALASDRATGAQRQILIPKRFRGSEYGEENLNVAMSTADCLASSMGDSGYGASTDTTSLPDVGSHQSALRILTPGLDNVSDKSLHSEAACSASIIGNETKDQTLCLVEGCQQRCERGGKHLLCIDHSFTASEWQHEKDLRCIDYDPVALEFGYQQPVDGHEPAPRLMFFEQQHDSNGTAVEECGEEIDHGFQHRGSQGRDEECDICDRPVPSKDLQSELELFDTEDDYNDWDTDINNNSLRTSESDTSISLYSDDTDDESQDHHGWEDGFVSNGSSSTCTDEERTTVAASFRGSRYLKNNAEKAGIRDCYNNCQGAQDMGESSKAAGKRKSTSGTGPASCRTSKKARRESKDNDEGGDDDNDKNRELRGTRQVKYVPKDGEILKGKFACPFAKQDPINHIECWTFASFEPGHVKQHLMRCHIKPVNCARCGKVFESRHAKHDLEMHTTSLERCAMVDMEGRWDRMMTTIQETFVSRRKDVGCCPQAYWFELFEALFPNCSLPEHPWAEDLRPLMLSLYASKLTASFRSTLETGFCEQTRFSTPRNDVNLENAKLMAFKSLETAVDKATSDRCSDTYCHHKTPTGAASDSSHPLTGPSSDSGFVSLGTEGVMDQRTPVANSLVHPTARTTSPDLQDLAEFNITTQLHEAVTPDPVPNNYTHTLTPNHNQENLDSDTGQNLDMEFSMNQIDAAGNMHTTLDIDNTAIPPSTLNDLYSFPQSERFQDFEQQYEGQEDKCINPAELGIIPDQTENETDSISSEILRFLDDDIMAGEG